MLKTISISDDVYEKLVRIKGKRSFSEVIRNLIEKKGNWDFGNCVRDEKRRRG